MPDQNTAATRSIVVGICLCVLAFAILVGYSVVASHQFGPRHTGVAATTNQGSGRSLTVERSKQNGSGPHTPGREDQVDQVLSYRIERHPGLRHHQQETTTPPSNPTPPKGRQGTENVALHLPTETGDTIQRSDDAPSEGSDDEAWDEGDSNHEASHRDHVPQGHAYGYWRNHGRGSGPVAARSTHSEDEGKSENGRHEFTGEDDHGSDDHPGNGHAYGHYKHGDASSSSDSSEDGNEDSAERSDGGWGKSHGNGHAYGHYKH